MKRGKSIHKDHLKEWMSFRLGTTALERALRLMNFVLIAATDPGSVCATQVTIIIGAFMTTDAQALVEWSGWPDGRVEL